MKLASAAPPKDPEPAKPDEPAEPEPLTPEQEAALSAWMQEKDESGELKRPWTAPGHPLQESAANTGAAVLADPRFASTADVLAEIDRRMGITTEQQPQPKPNPNVLPGGGTVQKRQTNGKAPALTDEEKKVARSMGIDEEAYQRQKQILSGGA
jgi:hypothetical protein